MNSRISASKMRDTEDRRHVSILLLRCAFYAYAYELCPFGLVIWYFFSCALFSVYCSTGVFDKYDEFAT